MVEIIKNILSKNTDQIAKKNQSINFVEDFVGKGLLNKEISKLYDKTAVLSEQQFADVIINSNVIIDKMSKLKKCDWNISELKSQLVSGVSNYQKQKINNNKATTYQDKSKLLNATSIGKHFNISSQRLNLILAELGWIEKALVGQDANGWAITKLGNSIGGKQFEHETSGGSYVLWPTTILENKSLKEVFNDTQSEKENTSQLQSQQPQQIATQVSTDYRDKHVAGHRTLDGHYVRSRAEVIIDNLLYQYGLVHAYERKIIIGDEEVLSDFYLPAGKVYIEFWGMESDPAYSERKRKKQEFYKKNDIPLIELNDNDILNLDDHLPRKLKDYGIKVY